MARRDDARAPSRRAEDDGSRDEQRDGGPAEIAIVGDLTDHEADLTDRLLAVEPGGTCTIYFDSPGGSPYCALSLTALLRLRGITATAVVTGECSSAALWPFAACARRLVTPYSVFLFHPMKWQSEEHIGLREAAEWSRHFGDLEREMDEFLCGLFGREADRITEWIRTHRYVSGREMVEAGLAELVALAPLPHLTAR
jgi:ATP-dependent Clp protease protease subunit